MASINPTYKKDHPQDSAQKQARHRLSTLSDCPDRLLMSERSIRRYSTMHICKAAAALFIRWIHWFSLVALVIVPHEEAVMNMS